MSISSDGIPVASACFFVSSAYSLHVRIFLGKKYVQHCREHVRSKPYFNLPGLQTKKRMDASCRIFIHAEGRDEGGDVADAKERSWAHWKERCFAAARTECAEDTVQSTIEARGREESRSFYRAAQMANVSRRGGLVRAVLRREAGKFAGHDAKKPLPAGGDTSDVPPLGGHSADALTKWLHGIGPLPET